MLSDIIDKLKDFLSRKDIFEEEAHVVYLLVELRKLLDSMRDVADAGLYSTVRFYADWAVHTEKSIITMPIKYIMLQIDESVPHHDKSIAIAPEHINFIYMTELKKELIALMQSVGLPNKAFMYEDTWISFVRLLVKVLIDQPIKNPTDNIASFQFKPAAEGAVIWKIEFKDSRGTAVFGNAY